VSTDEKSLEMRFDKRTVEIDDLSSDAEVF
jgi:hypothetical protein